MRFSSIAVIFQCANFLGSALAAYQTSHIAEDRKKFDCNGFIIKYVDYRDDYFLAARSILNDEHPHPTSRGFISDYLGIGSDTRFVLFLDESSVAFYSSDLRIPMKTETTNRGTLQTSYFIILDNESRTVAMFMRVTNTHTDRFGESWTGTSYNICGIVRN
ncbi:BgTH12-05191 [Blumeria graminis f. sp. triticale]|uniref:BgTH12-05191 n=1 Tax=Blumeria graminis f. sp. triticale TaxID=1689686 RepID=A0A9W4D0Z5_BLUGR|nr:BgTH12-05191 [Blumeria graminis f. sp. triticale]